ncbi:MAG TPA: esterase-like activity of phytase family protein [Steroidobacteraceae bacterium]|nr:esterase-like activity of phytase family protein [Steroidobacteraceae bacterium]
MKFPSRALTLTILACCGTTAHAAPDAGVQLVGRALVSGTALDKSGLDGLQICRLEDHDVCIDQATFGGWGSGLTYTGSDNVFLAAPDRGPFDGRTDVPYKDRVHFIYMAVDTTKPVNQALRVELLDTRLLVNGKAPFVGDSASFLDRLDPEGIVATADKGFIISDEYGPQLLKFGLDGKYEQRIQLPAGFAIQNPSANVYADGTSCEIDSDLNQFGRQANRGMESLAITPDGSRLVGLMQNALIQDGGLAMDPNPGDNCAATALPPSRAGFNSRIVTIDLKSGASRQYVYTIDGITQGRGQNDMLAVNDHQFLVLERDNRTRIPTPPNTSQAPNEKRLYLIDLNEPGLTDVSSLYSLPATPAALATAGIKGVTKHLFLDLLNTAYTVDGVALRDVIAEKVEGIAWGPDLPDGRHLLLVTTDNDLFAGDETHPGGLPTQVYAFAIDGNAAGVEVVPQSMKGPFFPPGQVRKIVGK